MPWKPLQKQPKILNSMNFGIIAAGEGSRLAGEGVSLPKPLVRIDGMPMIGRLISIFENCGARRICVIVNEQMTEVADYVRSLQSESRAEILLVVKSTPSSMHSFYELGKHLRGQGRFVVTTVDTIFHPADFAGYIKAFAEAPGDISGMMAVTRHIDDEKPLYVATGPDMRIEAFCDEYRPGIEYVSGGIYGLDTAVLDVLDDCFARGVSRMRNYQRMMIEAGLRLEAYDMGKIIDVDHAGDIEKAQLMLNEKNG